MSTEARREAAKARMETIRGLFLRHDWRFVGVTEGYLDRFVRSTGPDSPENTVEKLVGAGQYKFRRGEQFARVGFVFTRLWRFDGRASSEKVQLKNTELARIQQVLHERTPLRPGEPRGGDAGG